MQKINFEKYYNKKKEQRSVKMNRKYITRRQMLNVNDVTRAIKGRDCHTVGKNKQNTIKVVYSKHTL